MFLRPQHFQQQDRYVERLLESRCAELRPYGWGFGALEIDESVLLQGKLALASCRGVLPDGTPFDCHSADDLPRPLEIPEDTAQRDVFLALPVRRMQAVEIDQGDGQARAARYHLAEWEIADNSTAGLSGNGSTPVQVANLSLRLLLETEELGEYSCLGVTRIVERRADGTVVLDEKYIPPCLDSRAAPRLAALTNEILGLLHHRGDTLAGQVSESGRGGVAEINDYLLLLLMNRYEPLYRHLTSLPTLHPELLYRVCVQLAGELSSFASEQRRPTEFPPYRHDALDQTFEPVIEDIRRSLRQVSQPTATPIPLEERKFGIRVGAIPDRNLVKEARFVLAVSADMPAEMVRRRFPAQAKIGPVEKIRDLVNRQLPGIGLTALPVAPRQIPFHAGYTYFELESHNQYWSQLETSGGLAIHLAGKFPGIQMALWAIRE